MRSKVAKVANFWGSGFGDLAGQKLTTQAARVANFGGMALLIPFE